MADIAAGGRIADDALVACAPAVAAANAMREVATTGVNRRRETAGKDA